MYADEQASSNTPQLPDSGPSYEQDGAEKSSGDQLVDELGRLGRKFVELLETAWSSDQRRQIEQDLRAGLNNVAGSLEEGLKDVSEKKETKEIIGKAENVADNVADRVRSSELANELARGLATGLHTLADEMDKLAREMRAAHSSQDSQQTSSDTADTVQSQDIPISTESEPESDT